MLNEANKNQYRTQLESVLRSEGFRVARQLSRLLRFLVESAIDGREGELKEVVVGVEVFGREPGYDPRVDPVVRVNANRLRAKLAEYYTTVGAADPIRIEVPKGGYAPVFSENTIENEKSPTTAARTEPRKVIPVGDPLRWAAALPGAAFVAASLPLSILYTR